MISGRSDDVAAGAIALAEHDEVCIDEVCIDDAHRRDGIVGAASVDGAVIDEDVSSDIE